MKTNLLEDWKDSLLNQKWKFGLHNDLSFQRLNSTINTLKDFFPEDDYTNIHGRINKTNFIKALLTAQHLGSLIYLNEIARIIDFYNSVKHIHDLNLKDNKGRIQYGKIRDRFLEIYVNMILQEGGIITDINDFYIDQNNRTRPLDSSFRYNGLDYLVECKKIHNEKGELFWDLNTNLVLTTYKYSKDFQAHELFGGYIILKNESNLKKAKNSAIQKYNETLKKYLTEYRSNNITTYTFEHKYEDDDIRLLIKPNHSFDFEKVKSEIEKDFRYFIVFDSQARNVISGKVKFRTHNSIYYEKVNDFLFNKVSSKLKQHKHSTRKKIYVFEIENLDIYDNSRSAIPINKKNVDWERMNTLLKGDIALIFLFRSMIKDNLSLDLAFLTPGNFDKVLLENLKRLEYLNI